MKYHTTQEVAKILGVSVRRVVAKIKQGHFPNTKHCDCEQRSWLICDSDLPIAKQK